jgi:hypothetical protein
MMIIGIPSNDTIKQQSPDLVNGTATSSQITSVQKTAQSPAVAAPETNVTTSFSFSSNLTGLSEAPSASQPSNASLSENVTQQPVANPQAENISLEINPDTPVKIQLKVLDDPNVELTASIVSPPMNGRLSEIDQSAGTIIYTPNPGFNGTDRFSYKANNGSSDSNVATVSIAVKDL